MRMLLSGVFAGVLCAMQSHVASAAGFGFGNFSVVVNADGTTARSAGVQQSVRFAAGRYLVEFTRSVHTCSYLAGPNGLGGGQASVALSTANNRTLEVRTFNRTGTAVNLAFTVLVSCSS